MDFEYDPRKSEANKIKHGIDFEEAKALWKDTNGLEIRAESREEDRYVLIASYMDRFWTAVFTLRDERIRLISARRSREKEIELYDNR
jgi:uncharacterized DUF497 family protein